MPGLLAIRDETVGALTLPSRGEALRAAAEHGQRQRQAAAIADLDRKRVAIENPQRSGWPYGGPSIALKR